MSELWQAVALLADAEGRRGIGLGVQSVLWSDARAFAGRPEVAGNLQMLAMTARALEVAKGLSADGPMDLLDALLPATLDYGRSVTGLSDLSPTFALNALVAVDNAAWMLHARETGAASFDALIPEKVRPALAHRHERAVSIPLVGYGVPVEDVVALARRGFFVLKVKIGSDPDGDRDPEKMLAWDIARLRAIHAAVGALDAPSSPTGRVSYYLDTNQRYDTRERLCRLLDAAERMGALERTLVLEEPFPEHLREDVRGLPVRVAADESAHTDASARERMDLGYGAIALKPIAKTMSMSLRIARAAHERGVPCFCADLTVNPVLVDWNRNVAARLAPFPGLGLPMLEVNGPQNYARWNEMRSWHPVPDASWAEPVDGVFRLDDAFYACSGGILEEPEHYARLVGAGSAGPAGP